MQVGNKVKSFLKKWQTEIIPVCQSQQNFSFSTSYRSMDSHNSIEWL